MMYSITFFLNGKPATGEHCKAASEQAIRGGLKPVRGHFCGVADCHGGCSVERSFGVACVYAGDYTWPKREG